MAVNKNDIIRAGLESQYDRWGDAHQFWTGLVAWNWSWVIVLGALAWLGFNTVTSARSQAA